MITNNEKIALDELKSKAMKKLHESEVVMYEYFCACPVGPERERAAEVYERIRTATRFV